MMGFPVDILGNFNSTLLDLWRVAYPESSVYVFLPSSVARAYGF